MNPFYVMSGLVSFLAVMGLYALVLGCVVVLAWAVVRKWDKGISAGRQWVVLIVAVLAGSVMFGVLVVWWGQRFAEGAGEVWVGGEVAGCAPLPEGFGAEDLVGRWEAKYFPGVVTDTLVLRGDGRYRQVYENRWEGYVYEGAWKRWYVEREEGGRLYVHLEGMRYCVGTWEVCKREDGGGGEWHYYDPCSGGFITMGGEVVLVAVGSEEVGVEDVAGGVLLMHMRSSVEGGDAVFIFQGE